MYSRSLHTRSLASRGQGVVVVSPGGAGRDNGGLPGPGLHGSPGAHRGPPDVLAFICRKSVRSSRWEKVPWEDMVPREDNSFQAWASFPSIAPLAHSSRQAPLPLAPLPAGTPSVLSAYQNWGRAPAGLPATGSPEHSTK